MKCHTFQCRLFRLLCFCSTQCSCGWRCCSCSERQRSQMQETLKYYAQPFNITFKQIKSINTFHSNYFSFSFISFSDEIQLLDGSASIIQYSDLMLNGDIVVPCLPLLATEYICFGHEKKIEQITVCTGAMNIWSNITGQRQINYYQQAEITQAITGCAAIFLIETLSSCITLNHD